MTFKKIFYLEWLKLCKLKRLILFLAICALLIFSIENGKRNYSVTLESAKLFQEIETKRVQYYLDYTYYGWYGISMMLIPEPYSILTPGIFVELFANVSSAERLSIFSHLKGRNLFKEKWVYLDFSGLIVLIGCFLSLIYGFEAIRNQDYIMFLTSFTKPHRVFVFIMVARVILLSIIFIVIASVALVVGGISWYNWFLLWFFLTTTLIFILFFLVGALIGTIKQNVIGVITLAITYFILVILCPWIIFDNTQHQADNLPSYMKTDLKNFLMIMDFEKKALQEIGIFSELQNTSVSKKVKNIVQEILNNEIKLFNQREDEMIKSMGKLVDYNQRLSSFFPVPFYISFWNEVGTKGYLNFLDFYSYSQKQKIKFTNYYVRKKFFAPNPGGKVASYMKGNECLYFSKSRLPLHFTLGLMLQVSYIIVLVVLNFFFIKRFFLRNCGSVADFPILIQPGKMNILLTGNTAIYYHPYYYLLGKSQRPPVLVNDQDARTIGFVYCPNLFHFPEIIKRAIHLVEPKKKWRKHATNKEKKATSLAVWKTLIEFSEKTGKILIFGDFLLALKHSEVKLIREAITDTNIGCLFITKNEYLASYVSDNLIFCPKDDSIETVKSLRNG